MATPTLDDVRTALNGVNAVEIPDATIQQAIDDAERLVDDRLADVPSGDIDPADRSFAIREWAAYRAWNSAPREHRQSAIDANTTWDVQQFTKRLERRKDLALAELPAEADATTGGASAAFFTSSGSVFDAGATDNDSYSD